MEDIKKKTKIPSNWKIILGGIQRTGCSNGWIVIDSSETPSKIILDNKRKGYASYPAALRAAYYIYNKDAYIQEERMFKEFLTSNTEFRDALTDKMLFVRPGLTPELDDIVSARIDTNTTLPWTDKKFLKLYKKYNK